jgi:hypothetical protein
MRSLGVIALLALAACGTVEPIEPPKVVEVVVEKIVNYPSILRQPCDTHPKQKNDVEEAVRLANSRLASVVLCNCKILRGAQLTEKLSPEHEAMLAQCPKEIRQANPLKSSK